MKSIAYRLALLIALLAALPAAAQDSAQDADCSMNLNPVIALLEQADELAEDGRAAAAVQLVANARADLERIEAACATGSSDTVALGEPLTVETSVGTYTFRPPVGWTVGELEDDFQVLGNSERVLTLDMSGSAPPTPETGEIFGGIGLITAGSFALDEAGDNASPIVLLKALGEDGMTSSGEEWVEPVSLTISDRDAAIAAVIADDYVITIMIIDAGRDENNDRLYGAAILVTAPGNDADWQPTVEAMLGSITLE